MANGVDPDQTAPIGQGFRFFQDWWAEVTLGAKIGGSFSDMMGPSISNQPHLTFRLYTLPTH